MELDDIKNNLSFYASKINKFNFEKSGEVSIWINTQRNFDLISKKNYTKKNPYHPIRPVYGEVFVVDYGSVVGFEFKDLHLGLIVQNDNGNKYGDTTIVLPITDYKTNEKFDKNIHFELRNKHFETVVNNGLDKDPSKIKLADITTIDKARLCGKVGKLKLEVLKEIKGKLRFILKI